LVDRALIEQGLTSPPTHWTNAAVNDCHKGIKEMPGWQTLVTCLWKLS